MGISLVRASSIITELIKDYIDKDIKSLKSGLYESGTWTPKVTAKDNNPGHNGTIVTLTASCGNGGHYMKIDNLCLFMANVVFGTNTLSTFGDYYLSLPFKIATFVYSNAGQLTWCKNSSGGASGFVKTKCSSVSDKLLLPSKDFSENDMLTVSGWFISS